MSAKEDLKLTSKNEEETGAVGTMENPNSEETTDGVVGGVPTGADAYQNKEEDLNKKEEDDLKEVEESGNKYGEYVIAEKEGIKIMMQKMLSKDEGGTRYKFWQVKNGHEFGRNSKNNMYKTSQLNKGHNKKLSDFIIDCFECEDDEVSKYTELIKKIVCKKKFEEWNKARNCKEALIGSGVLDMEDIWNGLLDYIIENCSGDEKSKFDEYKGKYIAICQVGEKSAMKVFKSIFESIAPENSFKQFKDYLFATDRLVHDYNAESKDCQKTMTGGKKAYCIKVDKEVFGKFKNQRENNQNSGGKLED